VDLPHRIQDLLISDVRCQRPLQIGFGEAFPQLQQRILSCSSARLEALKGSSLSLSLTFFIS
jgi:hypothetical protein